MCEQIVPGNTVLLGNYTLAAQVLRLEYHEYYSIGFAVTRGDKALVRLFDPSAFDGAAMPQLLLEQVSAQVCFT